MTLSKVVLAGIQNASWTEMQGSAGTVKLQA